MTISRFSLHRKRHVSDNICRENQNTHFKFITLFPKIVSFMRKCGNFSRARQCTDGSIIRRMRFACWTTITKATDTHSKYTYVTPITFPRQQCLRKRCPMLCYTYNIACLFFLSILIYYSLITKSFDAVWSEDNEATNKQTNTRINE